MTSGERWRQYAKQVAGPGTFFASAGPALGGQINNEPEAWGQGMAGYSRRLADRYGRLAVRGTYQHSAAALLGHDVRYLRSGKTGFFPRAGHALASTFVTRDRNGGKVLNVSLLASSMAAEFTANTWRPDGFNSASRAVRGSGFHLSINSGFNLLREFAPEMKRAFRFGR